jgi:hypothetical protein
LFIGSGAPDIALDESVAGSWNKCLGLPDPTDYVPPIFYLYITENLFFET